MRSKLEIQAFESQIRAFKVLFEPKQFEKALKNMNFRLNASLSNTVLMWWEKPKRKM